MAKTTKTIKKTRKTVAKSRAQTRRPTASRPRKAAAPAVEGETTGGFDRQVEVPEAAPTESARDETLTQVSAVMPELEDPGNVGSVEADTSEPAPRLEAVPSGPTSLVELSMRIPSFRSRVVAHLIRKLR